MSTPNKYAIILSDKDFSIKARLEPFVTSLTWEWNRIGGCGKCTITVSGNYARFDINSDDDVQIYLPDIGGLTASLWYRGYVESVSPNVGSTENITIQCTGYFGWMDRVIVQDGGQKKVYTDTEISQIVTDVVNTFVVPNSSITLGDVDVSAFTPDTIQFKGTAKVVLDTLFDLLGTVEYGVNADLEFFWHNQLDDVTYKFYFGDKVNSMSNQVDYRSIVNKIYFEGGTVDGVVFQQDASSASSQRRYGVKEAIVSNGSITTANVANQYITGVIRQKGLPQRQLSASLINIKKRLEVSLPIGNIAIVDPGNVQDSAVYGTTGAGGSNKLYGTVANGGSGQKYGGPQRHLVDRISYKFSPEDGRVDADIQFGNSLGVSLASASIKKIQEEQEAQRQRSL